MLRTSNRLAIAGLACVAVAMTASIHLVATRWSAAPGLVGRSPPIAGRRLRRRLVRDAADDAVRPLGRRRARAWPSRATASRARRGSVGRRAARGSRQPGRRRCSRRRRCRRRGPRSARPASAAATDERAGALGDDVRALGEQADGRGGLVQRATNAPASSGRARSPHVGQQRLRAGAVDERGAVVDRSRLAGGERGASPPRRSPARRRTSASPGAACREGARDPGEEPAAAPGHEHRVDVVELLRDLEPDRAVSGHHRRILDRVDEEAVEPGEGPLLHRLPPALERTPGSSCRRAARPPGASPPARGRARRSSPARRARVPSRRRPGPCCRRSSSRCPARPPRPAPRRSRSAAPRSLNEPIGLEALELQPDLARCVVHVQAARAASRGRRRGSGSRAARISSSGIRTPPRRRCRARAPARSRARRRRGPRPRSRAT